MLTWPRPIQIKQRSGFSALVFIMALVTASPSYADPADLFVNGLQGVTTEITTKLQTIFTTKQAVKDGEMSGLSATAKDKRAAIDQAENTLDTEILKSTSKALSMAQSSTLSDGNKLSLSALIQNGDTGNVGRPFFAGAQTLKNIKSIDDVYCDPTDNDGASLCTCDPAKENCSAKKTIPGRYNRDLEIARFVNRPTLDINMTDEKSTPDELDIQSFINNITPPLSTKTIIWENAESSGQNIALMNFRHVIAQRNVTRNTMTNIIGNRSAGSDGSRTFLIAALTDLGMSEAESKKLLGIQGEVLTKDKTADLAKVIQPSYNAQMLVLSKKTYQSPNFYAQLLKDPANIERSQATMTAIGLMQRRDMYESLLRRELLLSQLLEMDINDEQNLMERRTNIELAR